MDWVSHSSVLKRFLDIKPCLGVALSLVLGIKCASNCTSTIYEHANLPLSLPLDKVTLIVLLIIEDLF